MTAGSPKRMLPTRDALADWDHVESRVVAQGSDRTAPVVTVAIPTFKRPELLVAAVRSALAQQWDRPFEIAIFDNDPTTNGWEALLTALPELATASYRYFAHAENMGIFGNFNRAVRLSRGEWVTVLMDDDLFDPDFLATMFEEIEARRLDGIVSHKHTLDERLEAPGDAASTPVKAARWPLFAGKFRGRQSRRVTGAKLFWWPGGVVGTPVGFLFRREAAIRIGGFYAEEGMAADYWFYARFAERYKLHQHRAAKVTVRIGLNESANPSTQRDFLIQTFALQQALAGTQVPRWWRRFSPLIIARQRAFTKDFWKYDIAPAEVEKMLGLRLPPDRPRRYKLLRMTLGGY